MSLADTIMNDYTETVCMIDETTEPDGRGGINTVWADGAEFEAMITPDRALTAQIAQAQTEIMRFRITTSKKITLTAGKYIRRLEDGTVYKILQSNIGKLAPDGSELSDIRSTTMEKAVLP